ncbi:MAG: hypothetical protein EOM54_07865 [Clostridia bacterium]|nr:hypothetical protein [Clostridia bacterium]
MKPKRRCVIIHKLYLIEKTMFPSLMKMGSDSITFVKDGLRMSASQDKRQRRVEREAGTDKRSIAKMEEEKQKRKSKMQWTMGTIITVLLVVVILLANSNLFYNVIPAVKIGDMSYTNAEYQYYYYNSYYQFCNNYSDYLNYFLDTSTSLEDQDFDSSFLSLFGVAVPDVLSDAEVYPNPTWADYFRETALASMTQITAIYEAATAEGYALSDEESAAIDAEIANYATYAEYYGYANAKKYISAAYGRGCNENIIRELMEMSYIASDYSSDTYDGFTYTADDLAAWYDENKDTYDTFDYTYYFVAADTVEVVSDVTDDETGEVTQETNEEVTDETMAAAKEAADALAAEVTDADSFAAAVSELSADAEPTEATLVSGYNLSSLYSEWMLDTARKTGDVTVAESEGAGYYVVMFESRGDNSYDTVSVRHILIKAVDEDEDGAYSAEELDAAKASIEAIYEEWQSGEATEESFAALADERSEDSGSNTTGGLYENIYKGQMVEEFNDFCFAKGRKAGDTAIVMGSSTSYSGYHLVYFVGEGEPYCDYLADSYLRSEDYTEWQDNLESNYSVNQNFVLNLAEK